MRRSFLIALAGLVALSAGTVAYVRTLVPGSGSVMTVSWPQGSTITYYYHSGVAAGPPNVVAGSSPIAAIDAGFQTVGAATGLTFVNAGNSGPSSAGQDNINTVTFASTPTNAAVVGGALAVASYTYNTANGRILEVDVVFNPASTFSTLGGATEFDIESIAAHEAGHAVGLEHSFLLNATMDPTTGSGSSLSRDLTRDERAGLSGLYSAASIPGTGSIAGTVQLAGGQPVGGAHIVAQDVITGRTEVAALSRNDGSYAIDGLAVGLYRLWAQPLTGLYSPGNISSAGWASAGFTTNFATGVLGGLANPTILSISPGQSVIAPPFTVGGAAATTYVAAAWPMPTATGGFTFSFGEAVALSAGYAQWIGIAGSGFDQLPDSAFDIDGPFISISGPSTQVGTAGSVGYKIFPVTVSADAPPGGYQVRVTDPSTSETHLAPGMIEVVPSATPQPYALAYGNGCPGPAGPLTLTAPTPPALGNAAFNLTLTGSMPGETALLVVSPAPVAVDVWPGCSVSVDFGLRLTVFDQFLISSTGQPIILPLPLSNNPVIAGLEVFVQGLSADPVGPPRLSNGLLLHFE